MIDRNLHPCTIYLYTPHRPTAIAKRRAPKLRGRGPHCQFGLSVALGFRGWTHLTRIHCGDSLHHISIYIYLDQTSEWAKVQIHAYPSYAAIA